MDNIIIGGISIEKWKEAFSNTDFINSDMFADILFSELYPDIDEEADLEEDEEKVDDIYNEKWSYAYEAFDIIFKKRKEKEVVQVIALNDDNHAKSYITREKHYSNFADFAKDCLLKPYDCEYEIREVYICEPQKELAEMVEDEFLYMFDLLDGCIDPDKADKRYDEDREFAFKLFWENGETWNYA